MGFKPDPTKKDKVECPMCGNIFERYIKDATQTCSRVCGNKMQSWKTKGIAKYGKKMKLRDEEREQEDWITCQHRKVFMGVNCRYGEGEIL